MKTIRPHFDLVNAVALMVDHAQEVALPIESQRGVIADNGRTAQPRGSSRQEILCITCVRTAFVQDDGAAGVLMLNAAGERACVIGIGSRRLAIERAAVVAAKCEILRAFGASRGAVA